MKITGSTIFGGIAFFVSALMCYEFIQWWLSHTQCLPPPYLYVTFHSNLNGVRKYSRDGCFMTKNILHGKTKTISEARSVGVGTYHNQEALYVCEARSKANYSKVLVFGECDSSGGRNYLHTVTSGTKNPGVNHPYGITFDHHGNIYVSFQHTNTVLRFKKDTFEPFPSPPYLPSSSAPDEPYPGTFYQYPSQLEGIRDVVFVNKYLWIANEDQKGISIVNLDGEEVHRIHMRDHAKPIGFHYDENVGLVFVSSRSSYGAVYGINPISREVEKVYYMKGMKHSTGVVSYDGILYVALQTLGKVAAFDIETTDFIEIIIEHFPDTVEKLALTNC